MSADSNKPSEGEPSGDQAVITEQEHVVARPRMFNVLLHNDDYTTMEFVILVLTQIFNHPERRAMEIMLHVHHQGVGVAGTFSLEVAQAKAQKVTRMAKAQEYPLRVSVEPA